MAKRPPVQPKYIPVRGRALPPPADWATQRVIPARPLPDPRQRAILPPVRVDPFGIVLDPRAIATGGRVPKRQEPKLAKKPRPKKPAAPTVQVPVTTRAPAATVSAGGSVASSGTVKSKPKKKRPPARRPQQQSTSPLPLTAEEQAAEFADALLAPQHTALDQQERNRQQAITQFTAELIRVLGGQPAAIEQDYNNAIAQQAALAAESRAGLQAASPDAQVQADLAAIGAPDAQREALARQLGNVFGGGGATLFETGGRIPGAALAADKAAELGFARTLPSVVGLQGQQNLATMLAQIAQERERVNATRPGLLLQREAQLADQALKQRAADWNEQYLRAQLGLKVDAQKFGQAAETERLRQGQARLELSTTQALERQRQWLTDTFGFDPATGLSTVEYKRYQLAEKKAGQSGKKGGFTAKQRRDMQAEAFATAQTGFVGGYTDTRGTFIALEDGKKQPVEVLRDLIGSGIPFDLAIKALNRFWPHTRSWSKK